MHFRRIDGDNAAARLYEILRRNPGQRFSAPYLARAAAKDPDWPLTALGTCVAEVRQQLAPGLRIECEQTGKGFYYTLVVERKPEQLSLC